MKARNRGNRALWMVTVGLLTTEAAWAGPYPLPLLKGWLKDAQARLAAVEQAIFKIGTQIDQLSATNVKLESVGRSPRAATEAIASLPTALSRATYQRTLVDLRPELVRLHAERRSILDEIGSYRVQIAAWDEMGRNDGGG